MFFVWPATRRGYKLFFAPAPAFAGFPSSWRGAPEFGSAAHLSHLFGRNLICVAGGVASALSRIATHHRKPRKHKPNTALTASSAAPPELYARARPRRGPPGRRSPLASCGTAAAKDTFAVEVASPWPLAHRRPGSAGSGAAPWSPE